MCISINIYFACVGLMNLQITSKFRDMNKIKERAMEE